MAETRASYAPEFSRQVVVLVRLGRDPGDLACEFGPTAQSIRSWVAGGGGKTGDGPGKGPASADADEPTRLRREAGVRPSMGSVGDAHDNAMCESFFATLECKLLARRRFASQAEARMAVFSFVEGWCNPVRLHAALGHQPSIACEPHLQEAAMSP